MTALAPAADQVLPLSRNRAFGLLWFGEGVSVLGNATSFVLLPLVAVVAFDTGPGGMGVLATASWLPWLLIGLPAGAWVDGLPTRGVMIAADLVSAVAYASVPVAWWLDVLTLAQLFLVALVGGAATVFFRTAYSAFLPQVVPPQHLETANGRLFGTESAMQIAGPGVGGLLAQMVQRRLRRPARRAQLPGLGSVPVADPHRLRPAREHGADHLAPHPHRRGRRRSSGTIAISPG